MTAVTITLDIGNTSSLNSFDNVTHISFGNSNTNPTETQTSLVNELLRVAITSKVKNTTLNTYTFIGRIPIFYLNSDTLYEIGLFDSDTGGNMAIRSVLSTGLTKTSNDELVFTLIIKTNTINKT